jgi:hypothetical protein
MSSLDKVSLIRGICTATQRLSIAGIRQRHPEATKEECLTRLALLKLGPELARRVYPGATELTEP